MVDEQLLQEAIAESGKTKTYLASSIGKSIQTFRLKCTNKLVFDSEEIGILCDELNITQLTQKEKIFFPK